MSATTNMRQRQKASTSAKPTCVSDYAHTPQEKTYCDWFNPSLNVVYAPGKRGVYASDFIPAGSVLLKSVPAVSAICDPEHSAQGNVQLGVSLLWKATEECTAPFPFIDSQLLPTNTAAGSLPKISPAALGDKPKTEAATAKPDAKKPAPKAAAAPVASKDEKEKEAPVVDSVPASAVLPLSAVNLFPTAADVGRMRLPNPLLGEGENSGKISVPAPTAPFSAAAQKRLSTLLSAPMGMAVLERCAHIARFNSVVAHGELPYWLPATPADYAAPTGGPALATAPRVSFKELAPEDDGEAGSAAAEAAAAARAAGKKRVALVPVTTPPTLAIFPALALLNHSCAPSAAPHFGHVPTPGRLAALTRALELAPGADGVLAAGVSVSATDAGALLAGETAGVMVVVTAARDVLPGEEITFNYVPLISTDGLEYAPWLPAVRRATTRHSHMFPCACGRCLVESGAAYGAQLIGRLDNSLLPTARAAEYEAWARAQAAAAARLQAKLKASEASGLSPAEALAAVAAEAAPAGARALTLPAPPANADALAAARGRATLLRSLLLNGVYNQNSADEAAGVPSFGSLAATLGKCDEAAVARAKALIEAEEADTPGAAEARWADEEGAVRMRAAGLYVHGYTNFEHLSSGFSLAPYQDVVSHPFMELLLPFADASAEPETAAAAAAATAGEEAVLAASVLAQCSARSLDDVTALLTAAAADAWRSARVGPAKAAAGAAAPSLPAPLAAGARASDAAAVRCLPVLVPCTTAHGAMIAPFGLRAGAVADAATGALEPPAPAAAAEAPEAPEAGAAPAAGVAVVSGIAAAAVAVPVDNALAPAHERHVERSQRLTFALRAYAKVRELLVEMPDEDELTQAMEAEDEEARARSALGSVAKGQAAGLSQEQVSAEAAAVAGAIEDVRRGNARTRALLRRNEACRQVALLSERALVQAAQVASPFHWVCFLLHSARATALERAGQSLAALSSRVATLVIAALSLPELHPSIGELAAATANACAEGAARFAADKTRLDFHTTQAADADSAGAGAAGEAEAEGEGKKLEMSTAECEAARAVMRRAALRVDALHAFASALRPLCATGLPQLRITGTKPAAE